MQKKTEWINKETNNRKSVRESNVTNTHDDASLGFDRPLRAVNSRVTNLNEEKFQSKFQLELQQQRQREKKECA